MKQQTWCFEQNHTPCVGDEVEDGHFVYSIEAVHGRITTTPERIWAGDEEDKIGHLLFRTWEISISDVALRLTIPD